MSQDSFLQTLKNIFSPNRRMVETSIHEEVGSNEEEGGNDKNVEPATAYRRDEKYGDCPETARLDGEEFDAIEALQSLNSQRSVCMDLFPTYTQDIIPTITQHIDATSTEDIIPTFTQDAMFTDQLIDLPVTYLLPETTINQVLEEQQNDDTNDDAISTSSYIINSRAPVVVPRLLWFQHDLTEEEKNKSKSPIWYKHVSVSGMLIGGVYSSLFTTVRTMLYPKKPNVQNEIDIDNWFNEHSSIVRVPMKTTKATLKTDGRIHGNQPLVHANIFRYAIKLRLNKVRSEPRKFQPYLFISKSLVGCRDYVFDAHKAPPNDQSYIIENKDKFAASGLGLFADRDFAKNEHIGLYCGKLTLKKYTNDTGYNIEWLEDRKFVVDAQGGIGYKVYFGWHFANNAERMEDANVIIDDELHVFALRDIKRGEEILFYYGERWDQVKNKKRKRTKN